mgnify:CR=1 FL=1
MSRYASLLLLFGAIVSGGCGPEDPADNIPLSGDPTLPRPSTVHTLPDEELAEGWISLFDGETLFGWEAASTADWRVEEGAIVASSGEKGLLCTPSPFENYELHLEFKAPAATNSGVFLRTPAKPTDPAVDCYELNIAGEGVSPFTTGGLVGREKTELTPPADGDWHTFDVTVDGDKVAIRLDGAEALNYTAEPPLPAGFIGLQFNEGEIRFRNVKLRPLGLESIFNGKDLTGWKEPAENVSEFTVTEEGLLNVKNGRGYLESEQAYGDFALQFECRTNAAALNSGMFFRTVPGSAMDGYECQIHNGLKEGDRTKPADCGTGGFFRRQDARYVPADDQTWFHLTLIAHGPHMAAWVNGYQVSDWTDTRPPHANPREGLRLEPGTLQIQGHDPTTDIDFRGLRIVEVE